jgi:2-hydroxy-3-keto-5-methylthiopentenyl-1-phosphate phosphatase
MSNKVVSVIASHNARIRCFFDKFFRENQEIRVKNCAIFRFVVDSRNISIEMVHSGQLDPNENKADRKYYVAGEGDKNPSSVVEEIIFEKKTLPFEKLGITSSVMIKEYFELFDSYVFYIVRHGQGVHNLSGATHLILDTDITPLGEKQAVIAGEKLCKVMRKNNEQIINNAFASDLVRTRQTIIGLYKGIVNVEPNFVFPKTIIILPCSHELKYSEKGNCDKTASFFKVGTRENDPKCSNSSVSLPQNKISNPNSECSQLRFNNMNIQIDWSHYMRRNNNKMRGFDCSTVNMVDIAMSSIKYTLLGRFGNLLEREDINGEDTERITLSKSNTFQRIGAGGRRKTRKYKKTIGKRKLVARRKTRRHKKSKK